jgi:hypothetical protein
MSKTQNWKNAEYYFANLYKKFKIPAYRESRGGDWGKKDFEVKIEGHPEIVSDSKYSEARPFRHHGLVQEAKAKYCKDKSFFPVILTKNYKERGGCISIQDKLFAMLLSYWLGYGTKEELWNIYLGEDEE